MEWAPELGPAQVLAIVQGVPVGSSATSVRLRTNTGSRGKSRHLRVNESPLTPITIDSHQPSLTPTVASTRLPTSGSPQRAPSKLGNGRGRGASTGRDVLDPLTNQSYPNLSGAD